MAAAPRVFLVFDGVWLEVEASLVQRRGGLRSFAREAESKWDLQPSSYEFTHASGKVDSCPALQRALGNSPNGVCKLEIVERLEGKMMRVMRKEMKLLEDRVMAKVETVLADVRKETQWNETRLSGSIAPLVQCLASEQIEMREKLVQLAEEVSNMEKAPAATDAVVCALKDADSLEQELQQECATQAACDLDLSTSNSLEELREEVCHLGQKDSVEAERTVPCQITKGPAMTVDFKHTFGDPDSRLQWPTGVPPAMAYSSKVAPAAPTTGFDARWRSGDKWSYVKLGDEVAAPFAQHFSKSTFGHRSCPLLPPLH